MKRNKELGITSGLLCLGMMLGAGCQSARNAVHCFAEDLTDIVEVDASFSFGTDMGAHVMATELLQAKAYDYEDVYLAGISPRQFGVRKAERSGWNLSLASSDWNSCHWDNVFALTSATGLSGKMATQNGMKAVCMESVDEIGAGFHLFIFGGRIGIRPLEIIDLFANLLTLDPLHDNLDWTQRQSLKETKKTLKKSIEELSKTATPSENEKENEMSLKAMQQQVDKIQKDMKRMKESLGTGATSNVPAY